MRLDQRLSSYHSLLQGRASGIYSFTFLSTYRMTQDNLKPSLSVPYYPVVSFPSCMLLTSTGCAVSCRGCKLEAAEFFDPSIYTLCLSVGSPKLRKFGHPSQILVPAICIVAYIRIGHGNAWVAEKMRVFSANLRLRFKS